MRDSLFSLRLAPHSKRHVSEFKNFSTALTTSVSFGRWCNACRMTLNALGNLIVTSASHTHSKSKNTSNCLLVEHSLTMPRASRNTVMISPYVSSSPCHYEVRVCELLDGCQALQPLGDRTTQHLQASGNVLQQRQRRQRLEVERAVVRERGVR